MTLVNIHGITLIHILIYEFIEHLLCAMTLYSKLKTQIWKSISLCSRAAQKPEGLWKAKSMPLYTWPHSNARNWEYFTSDGKGNLEMWLRLSTMRWEIILNYPSWSNLITWILKCRKLFTVIVRQKCDYRGIVRWNTAGFEDEERRPWSKECGRPLGVQPLRKPDFSPVRPMWDFWPHNCKPLNLWPFVRAAIEN